MNENNLKYCVYSFMTKSVKKVKRYATIIRESVALFRANGKEFLIHNHDMEWMEDSGTSVMRWLLENIPELCFELDLGWTEYAGVDSVKLLLEYPDRFPLLHIKEIAKDAPAHQATPFCTTPGEGILPLDAIVDAIKKTPIDDCAIIIDQDDSVNQDIIGDITSGVNNLLQLF